MTIDCNQVFSKNSTEYLESIESIDYIASRIKRKITMRLTDKAITAIRKNNMAIGRLIMEFNRGQNTIENWLKNSDSPLTTPKGLSIISEETGLSQDEILEDSEEVSKVTIH